MTKNTWKVIASLPEDSAISGMSVTHETTASRLWLCSPAGLFYEKDGQFKQQVQGIPFQNASAVLGLAKTVLAAGYPNYILYSANGGHAWFRSWVEPITSPITCFAASPHFSRDPLVLAGSDGNGILRSTDGGASWQISNHGLGSLYVLALLCAPAWKHKTLPNGVAWNEEIVFAATEAGVYRSPNAGRAWQFCSAGLPNAPILSLALSPDFDKTPSLSDSRYMGDLFAGMDNAGLYRSRDGGQTWQALSTFPAQATVNALLFDSRHRLLAGTGKHGLLASTNLGETWFPLLESEAVILCLAEQGNRLLAGTAENGLLACTI
ncbi:MAG: hypothetical protein Fur0043_17210 [Anaerolineales bacterium]